MTPVPAADDFLYDDLAKDLGGAPLPDFICCLGVTAALAGDGAAGVSPGRKSAAPPVAAAVPLALFPFMTLAMLMLPAAPAPFLSVDFANDLGVLTISFGARLLPADLATNAWPAPAGEATEPFTVHDDLAYDFGLPLAGGGAAELPFPEFVACLEGMPNAPPPADAALPAAVAVDPLKEALAKDFGGAVPLLAAGVATPFDTELLLAIDVAAVGAAVAA